MSRVASSNAVEERKNLTLAAGIVGGSTAISRVLGLLRDMILFSLFPPMATDAFVVAFRLPNLFRRLLGEGSLSVSFVPVFTEYLQVKPHEARRLLNSFFSLTTVLLVLTCLLGILFAEPVVKFLAFGPGFANIADKYELTTLLTRIMFPYLLLVGFVALFMGVLNSVNHFFSPSIAPIFLSLGEIFGAVYLAQFFLHKPIIGAAIGVVLGGILQVVLQLPFLRQKQFFPKFTMQFFHPGSIKILWLMAPAILGLSAGQLALFVMQEFASFLPEGAISHLFLADRLIQLPLGVFAIALGTAVLPSFSRLVTQGDKVGLAQSFSYSLRLVWFIVTPAAVGLALLALPIVRLLFERGEFQLSHSQQVASAISASVLGLWAAGGLRVVVPVFYAFKNTALPALSSLGSILLLVTGCFVLKSYGVAGLSWASSISIVGQFIFLSLILSSRYVSVQLWPLLKGFFKIVLSTAVMAGGLLYWKSQKFFMISNLFLEVFISIGIGVLLYAASSSLICREEFKALKKLWR